MRPDLAIARRFLDAHLPAGQVLMCAITGSHQYGFPSADSDLDIKGIHLAPIDAFLGLGQPRDAHDRLLVFEGVECDLTTHEAAKALSLLLRGNGNILERLASPYQLIESDALEALRALIPAALSRAVYGHYAGYFRGMQREHEKTKTVKSLLYTYRVALTGVHLLQTGVLEADLRVHADAMGFPELHSLIEQKREAERIQLDEADSQRFRERWNELDQLLLDARDQSPLPKEAPRPEALEEWLVQMRRSVG